MGLQKRVTRWFATRKDASPLGIDDLAGNVYEWCLDFYESYKSGERTNPRGPQTGTQKGVPWGKLEIAFCKPAHDGTGL